MNITRKAILSVNRELLELDYEIFASCIRKNHILECMLLSRKEALLQELHDLVDKERRYENG